tara:strand:- start:335 stop:1429 length:1095 start_codon:yes stop_codon:yes gene_type:complete
MKKITGIVIFSIFIAAGTIYAQNQTIYARGGESIVNWNEIMSEYERQDYEGPPFWFACISAPHNAKASSTLSPQGKYNYNANNLNDNDPRTAWVEGKSDYGLGEYFSVQGAMFQGEDTNIYIYNGYQQSVSSWKNNSRVKKLRVYVDNRPICYVELKDIMGGQYFNLSIESGETMGKFGDWEFQAPWVKFEIVEVYKGDKWNDVAISEIHTRGCCFNSNTNILNFNEPISIGKLEKGQEVSSLDIETGEIKVTNVILSAKQIHHTLLRVSTEYHTVELTPSHPLFIKGYGLMSLDVLKRDYNFANYEEMLGKIEILVWNKEKGKSEYQQLIKINKIKGDFETHTILKLERGKTYIANGFVTSIY